MTVNVNDKLRVGDLDVNKIIMERINQGLSRADLAYAAGLDRDTVANFERGKSIMLYNVYKILNCLNVDYRDYLKNGKETELLKIEDIDLDRIKEERIKQGYSNEALSYETGLSRTTIEDMQTGRMKSRLHNVARVTNFLGFYIEEFKKM